MRSSIDENRTLGNVAMKIGVKVEPSNEFCNVANALGFVRIVHCPDCVYNGTPDCKMKDDVKYKYYCSYGLKEAEKAVGYGDVVKITD